MNSCFARLRLVAGLLAAASSIAVATAQPRPSLDDANMALKPGHEAMMNNFTLSGGDVDAVLEALQANTGRIVIHPTALPPGTYTISVDHPIPMREFVLMLETQLYENGIAVIPMGKDFLKVVPITSARTEAPPFIEGSTLDLPASNQIATKLFQFRFLRASEVFQGGPSGSGFQSMLTNQLGNAVVILDKQNAALVTDTISNLQRIEELIDQMDKPMLEGFDMKFYSLQNSKASDLVQKLQGLLKGPIQSQLGTGTVFNADDRTNQLVVIADKREMPFFDELVQKLDMPSAPNTRTDVIFLQHADATTLQTVISTVITGQVAALQKANATAVRPGETTAPGAAATPAVANTISALPAAAQAAIREAGASGAAFSPYATITADERSNSVVVSGTADDVRLVHDLVEKLDQALKQVRIQVIIAEVTLSDTDISGISSLGLTVGQNSHGGTSILSWAGSAGTGLPQPQTSIAGWDFTNGTVNPLAFNAAFNPTSAGQKSRVHVLSAPVIVTMHNKPAEVQVGESLPLINSTINSGVTTTNGALEQSESVSYTNVTIDLKVTPLIGDHGDIQLNVDQKVQTVIGETEINGSPQPTLGVREATSWVTVKDGQMIVLGGMQQTQKTESQNKIGFLYEIPILSQLLGGHTDDLERTELLFFIRPHIVNLDDTTSDTEGRIDELSSRKDVNEFLQNPTPPPNNKVENFLDRFKGDN